MLCPLLLAASLLAQAPAKSIHPQVKELVEAVDETRIASTMKHLGEFPSRNTNYEPGNKAAREWIASQLRSYSPRLDVRFDSHALKRHGRIERDLDVVNVVATLEGTTQKHDHIIICAHYDSLNLNGVDGKPAPGVSDNASGVALVLELARLMSQQDWPKTLVFIAFSGEEQGLYGSRAYAGDMKRIGRSIAGVFNNDIIGNDVAGDGRRVNHIVNVFSADPADSPSRALARYVSEVTGRYYPAMHANAIFRSDRFGRGGDHTPFHDSGFAAIRFTTPVEHYGHQHSGSDTFEHSSPEYTTRVVRVNAAAVASLALAPAAPVVTRGAGGPNLGRGNGYDAVLRWTPPFSREEIAGYSVVVRPTTSAFWEREIHVGDVTEFTLPNVSIDDVIIGVRSIGKNGIESPAATYVLVPPNFNTPATP